MSFERFKQNTTKSWGDLSLKTSYEAVLINLLNSFLNLKQKDLKDKKIKVKNAYEVNYYQTISIEQANLLKVPFNESLEFYFAKYDNEYQIKKYLAGYASFEAIEDFDAELITNKKYSLYRKTLEKGAYDETYLANSIINNKVQLKEIKAQSTLWDKQFKLDILSSLEYFNFLNIPTRISVKDNVNIDVSKVLLLLKTFSLFNMPQGNIFIGKKTIQRKVPEEFKALFYSDYIVCYEENDFIDKCVKYFNWSKKDTKDILDFITNDLNINNNLDIDVKSNPLIKIGNQYFWLSSFMKDRRWEMPMHSKLVKEKLINPQKISDESENYLSNIFKEANFNSISSFKYVHGSKKGEIDLLAYKDGVLFIGELKSTYVIENMMKTSKYETEKFNKASDQLDLAKDYVQNNFNEIKKELNIECFIEDLKIETIIISNIYQADHLKVNNKHLKVSLFELLIILKNDLYNMLIPKAPEVLFGSTLKMSIDDIINMYNRNNPDHKVSIDTVSKETCNLWKNKNECSPNDILSAISKNKIWKHQDASRKFPEENLIISTYNKNYSYLG